jgi:amino acid transporter
LRSPSEKVFLRKATGIVKELSALDTFALTMLLIGLGAGFVFYDYYVGIFHGTDIPLAILLAALPCIPIAIFYWLMTVAFPRTGGDYVWTSRILHPSIGFANNFLFIILVGVNLGVSTGYFVYETQTLLSLLSIWFYSPAVSHLANVVVEQPWFTTVALAYLVVVFVLTASIKALKAVARIGFVLNIIAVVLIFAEYLPVTPKLFESQFDIWAGGVTSYQSIIAAAARDGFVRSSSPVWLLMATMFIFGLYYGGYNWGSFYSGEIRQVHNSVPLVFLGAIATTAFVWYASSALLWYKIGPDFLSAASYLKYSHPDALAVKPLEGFPMPRMFYLTFLMPSGPLGLIAKLLVVLGATWFFYYMWTFSFMMVISRQIFAWSFDRLLPSSLADINQTRWIKGPFKALTFAFLIGLAVTLFANVIPSILALTAVWGLVQLVAFWVPGLAGIIFPFRKKGLFDSSPAVVRKMIGPVPAISLLGLLTTMVSVFGAYQIFINPLLGGSTSWDWVVGIFVLGFGIYWVAYFARKRQNIDLNLTFKEIPPE